MTWLDWTLIAVLALFFAVGARLGSLWTAACLGAGFLGALLADVYALPLSSFIGRFAGANTIAAAALFVAGAAAILIPGLFLSRLCKGLILGVADSVFGLLTGGAAGFIALSILLLVVVPFFPSIERMSAWRGSEIVRPTQVRLESLIGPGPRRAAESKAAALDLTPLRDRANAELKGVADRVTGRLKG